MDTNRVRTVMKPDCLLGQPMTLVTGTHLLTQCDLVEDQWNIAWQFGRPELPAEPLVLPPAPWEDIQQGAAIRTPSSLAAEGTR